MCLKLHLKYCSFKRGGGCEGVGSLPSSPAWLCPHGVPHAPSSMAAYTSPSPNAKYLPHMPPLKKIGGCSYYKLCAFLEILSLIYFLANVTILKFVICLECLYLFYVFLSVSVSLSVADNISVWMIMYYKYMSH